jgi:hypothetical protein
MSFCITGLPRSRTAWFAAYFSAAGHYCTHEPKTEIESEGISDSFMVFLPFEGRRVIIERNPDEVKESLTREFGLESDITSDLIDIALEKMKALSGLRVKYEDINSRLQEIHEYCVDSDYNKELAEMFMNFNIQIREVKMTEEYINKVGGALWQDGRY